MAARLTKFNAEAIRAGQPKARLTKFAVDSMRTGAPAARVTKFAVETLRTSAVWSVSASNSLAFSSSTSATSERPSTYQDVILKSFGLAHYWALDEGFGSTQASDGKGSANLNISPTDVTLGSSGNGRGIQFSAAFAPGSSTSDIGTTSQVSSLTHSFTLEAWVKTNDYTQPDQPILTVGVNSGTPNGYELAINDASQSTGSIRFKILGITEHNATGVAITDSDWHYLVITSDGSGSITFWLDGISAGSVVGPTFSSTPTQLYIGYDGGSSHFNGNIASVALYNGVVSGSVIADHYRAGNAFFLSASNALNFTSSCVNVAGLSVHATNSLSIVGTMRTNGAFNVSAASVFALAADGSEPTNKVVSAGNSLAFSCDAAATGIFQVFASAFNSISLSTSATGPSKHFASAANFLALRCVTDARLSPIRASASNAMFFSVTTSSPSDFSVSARNFVNLWSKTDSYVTPIVVSASNTFALSGMATTLGPYYVSASSAFTLSASLSLLQLHVYRVSASNVLSLSGRAAAKQLHVYRVSAANAFSISSATDAKNWAIYNVAASNTIALSSSASGNSLSLVSASNALAISGAASQARDVPMSASTTFGLTSSPGSNGFPALSADSTFAITVSAGVELTGTDAENSLTFGSYAWATVQYPWRRSSLSLDPGGGLPHS